MITKTLKDYCRKLNCNLSALKKQSSKQPLPLYRAVFSYMMYPQYSQTEIAKLFNQQPSTINNAMRRLEAAISVGDKSITSIFDKLGIDLNNKQSAAPEFNSFSQKVYNANKLKGFHDTLHSNKHHLCLIVSELMEAIEADRKGLRANLLRFNFHMGKLPESEHDSLFPKYFRLYIKDSVEDELADAVIRLFDFAGARNYNLYAIPYTPDRNQKSLLTESIWDVIYELVACEEEEAVFCAIKKIEELCSRISVNLWKHVELKLKYNRTRPYKHNKLY